jgi:hypothetical protein
MKSGSLKFLETKGPVKGSNGIALPFLLNPLAPSDPYMGRTAQLTSRRCILNIYSTNIRTEYFKNAV